LNPFVTFIIPTIGRETLKRTFDSLYAQTDQDWNAIVVGDNVESFDQWYLRASNKVFVFNSPFKRGHDNVAADVRNIGLALANSEWIASLDDDDTIVSKYVEWLKEESKNMDLVHFRAELENGVDIRPPFGNYGFQGGNVSNAFCFRREFAKSHGIQFIDGTSEDWETVKALIGAGARAKMSGRVAYRVRH
jgi:glycosyltransferase involved in cell wall biosynthesis